MLADLFMRPVYSLRKHSDQLLPHGWNVRWPDSPGFEDRTSIASSEVDTSRNLRPEMSNMTPSVRPPGFKNKRDERCVACNITNTEIL